MLRALVLTSGAAQAGHQIGKDPEVPQSEAETTPSDEEGPAQSREEELIRKNAALERVRALCFFPTRSVSPPYQSLAQALVNAEVTEASNQTLLQELQEARTTVTRLSSHHARSLGWEMRLRNVLQERDDLQQERDSLLAKARISDQRTGVLKDKCCECSLVTVMMWLMASSQAPGRGPPASA
jgi:hypothetical protein